MTPVTLASYQAAWLKTQFCPESCPLMTEGLKQAELAKIIHETVAVVNSYEMGKAVPTNAVLGKMERALSVKLRGKM